MVDDAAPENRGSDYTCPKMIEKSEINSHIGDQEITYTKTNPVKHPTRADFSRTQENREEDISSAGSERGKESLRNNTVITGRQTGTAVVRNRKLTSEGKLLQTQRLYLGQCMGM